MRPEKRVEYVTVPTRFLTLTTNGASFITFHLALAAFWAVGKIRECLYFLNTMRGTHHPVLDLFVCRRIAPFADCDILTHAATLIFPKSHFYRIETTCIGWHAFLVD
jgi:hypothetical protein